jgi:hypothetical protein
VVRIRLLTPAHRRRQQVPHTLSLLERFHQRQRGQLIVPRQVPENVDSGSKGRPCPRVSGGTRSARSPGRSRLIAYPRLTESFPKSIRGSRKPPDDSQSRSEAHVSLGTPLRDFWSHSTIEILADGSPAMRARRRTVQRYLEEAAVRRLHVFRPRFLCHIGLVPHSSEDSLLILLRTY